ncbi:MAG: hypothetical protein ACLR56_12535 [Oscillospiraceae bacterium]
MKRFAGVIARTTGNSVLQKAAFSDWLDLFQAVADYKPNEEKGFVIDEFPYLVKVNDSFRRYFKTPGMKFSRTAMLCSYFADRL